MEKMVASIVCANPLELGRELRDLKDAGVDWLHCDVMDGNFVNNLAMAPYNIKPLIEDGGFTIDLHLACQEPVGFIELFGSLKPDYLTVHYEALDEVGPVLELIRSFGIKVGLAISPQTPVTVLYPYLGELDLILIMTVEPGFVGQAFQWPVLRKIKELNLAMGPLEKPPLIQVDGHIDQETVSAISPLGANLYVLGTAALFNREVGSYQEKIQCIRTSLKSTR